MAKLAGASVSFDMNQLILPQNITRFDIITLSATYGDFVLMLTMGLEQEIADVVKRVCSLHEDEIGSLNYTPVILTKKFAANELLLKNRIEMNVTNYYPYIRDCFKELEGINNFRLTALSLQIKSCFIKMEGISDNKSDIFDQLVDWVMSKTLSTSRDACEAVVSFFVQNCEVFQEITE